LFVKLKDRIVVVTGAGNGIGRQLVIQLLARGAKVAGVDIRQSALEETAALAKAGADVFAHFTLDVTDRAGVEALPGHVIARFGAVDGLINNAGMIQPFVRLKDLEYAAIERVMNVNFLGTLYMTKAFLPHLLARPVAHITNVSSMGGFLPVPGQTIYGSAKAAVKLLTEGLRSELLATNVKVTVVFPGAIETNIAANSGIQIPMGQLGERSIKTTPASRAAELILDGIENDAVRVLVGPDARLMDLLYRLNPRRAAELIYQLMKSLLPT
jgi:NAD(P)-dependent dehydrogenase (short-subunit alcohol dehydrogenase family)